ncbi:MAG: hypothetical protein ABIR24_13560 [Verrucomicrobiota bacterium]
MTLSFGKHLGTLCRKQNQLLQFFFCASVLESRRKTGGSSKEQIGVTQVTDKVGLQMPK